MSNQSSLSSTLIWSRTLPLQQKWNQA